MKLKSIAIALYLMFLFFFMGGYVAAQAEQESDDREYCELDAKEQGMLEVIDISDYVEECLADLEQAEEMKEPDNDDGEADTN